MTIETIGRATTFVLVVAGSSMLAAPQQTTRAPGQMTEAHVWVQNHGKAEAVPVELREVNLDAPLKVEITNADAAHPRTGAVIARQAQQAWDYHTIVVKDGQDPVAALIGPGAAGWETTGIAFVKPDGVTLLLKRPHLP
jgi:hypothetical protein